MTDEPTLFGDDDAASTAPSRLRAATNLAAPWQRDLVRRALDSRGIVQAAARKSAVEAAIGRSVESLAALTSDEALLALSRLGPAPEAGSKKTSAWDERDHETWIDQL